jgi:lipooligosaccharide transport system permease protein
VQAIATFSPLYHGVELVRGLMLGVLGPGMLLHVAVLALLGAVGLRVAVRRLGVLLLR